MPIMHRAMELLHIINKTVAAGECDKMATTHVIKHFNENNEVGDIINRVIKICRDDIALESDLERLTVILDEYQEQPHLLDPYLEEIICSCLDTVKDKETPEEAFHQTFRYLYLICKTRGAKYVLRFFTHEVADMEPVLHSLSQQNIHDFKTWQTRYCLLLWLSIICMIPFDLVRFDGSSNENGNGIIDSILSNVKKFISVADKSRDAAAYLLAKFLSRPDVRKLHLSEFLHWCIDVIMRANYTASMEGLNSVYGSLSVLCYIFKHGSREDLLVHAVDIFRKIEEKEFAYTFDILLKKLTTKVVQRLGLCLLKPRLAPWRYQRGNRSLLHNLQNPYNNAQCLSGKGQGVDDDGGCEEENYEVPEDIEQILQHMLFALKDKDTVVRWSAAKGIGRICGRLPKDLADDVIGSVLEFFNPMEPDTGWHGGCLALAELGKRGLLLPERLPEVVPLILKALVFDERHVSYSSGANVRDAACYACWAFARAYEPKELTSHVTKIASALVIVSLFDREPNCRRAASAAFQEHVGRQGTFPHGIDILTTVDYFSVGNITNCYINLSVFVAKFPEYTQAIIDHLVDYKVCHWDRNVRQLASQSLAKLTAVSPHYMKCNVFPSILLLINSTDLNTRHGALLAVAEVGEAIYSVCADKSGLLDGESLHRIENIVSFLKENNYFNGLEGDFMRTAESSCEEGGKDDSSK
ncbi:tubulin-specific chaperone D-like [Rhopilema esculentum]|uniref:tubulin-specific chaperone D-like n=1 Tax=Rhopilema esculentum TaxID=499914 RepID=UPI0031DBD84C